MTKKMKEALEAITDRYVSLLENDLSVRWNQLKIDISKKEVYEVLAGQLARQITLADQFARNYNCWTYDLAPIILRCMADNYINYSWIINSPEVRSKLFISHGLGQEKLILEHRKNQILSDGGNPDEDPLLKLTEEWLNSERYAFLTEVNIGSWSGISIRQMAEEAGCIDFYNYVYTPFSTVAHNMWGHISKCNLKVSGNPLHKLLKEPFIGGMYIDLHNLKLAAKYLDKMIRKFDETFNIVIEGKSTYERFLSDFNEFEETFSNTDEDVK